MICEKACMLEVYGPTLNLLLWELDLECWVLIHFVLNFLFLWAKHVPKRLGSCSFFKIFLPNVGLNYSTLLAYNYRL